MAGLYVHIPLCKQRCIYCDFYSTTHSGWVDDYLSALHKEALHRSHEIEPHDISTLYIGGGTPSQLTLPQLSLLVEELRDVFDLSGLTEFTVEVNPDDVTKAYAHGLRSIGVNRVSMGIQSFDDNLLRFMCRRHDAQGALRAVDVLRLAGMENMSIDLIYGIPGQSMKSWEKTVEQAISLNVQHISAYCLSYEEGTRLWQMREAGKILELTENEVIEMYERLLDALQAAGYVHYEISNFCLPDFYSRHNSSYWDGTPYLGLGASAHSFDGKVRRYNPADVATYIAEVSSLGRAFTEEVAQEWERYDEAVMIRLRTCKGIDVRQIHDRFGPKFHAHMLGQAQEYIAAGWLIMRGGHLCLTREGIMRSDAIIRDLMW